MKPAIEIQKKYENYLGQVKVKRNNESSLRKIVENESMTE